LSCLLTAETLMKMPGGLLADAKASTLVSAFHPWGHDGNARKIASFRHMRTGEGDQRWQASAFQMEGFSSFISSERQTLAMPVKRRIVALRTAEGRDARKCN
jgi:hypothetical protein